MKTMFFRKIETKLNEYYKNNDDRIIIVTGARQIGKSFIIRETAQAYFKNYIEINMQEDRDGDEYFKDIKTTKEEVTSQNTGRKINFKNILYHIATLGQCISGNISI